MSRLRKIMIVILVCALSLAMFACGSPATSPTTVTGGTTGTTAPASYDQVVFAYATFNNIPAEEARKSVEEEINKITRVKIGAEITLMPIAIWDYRSQVSLALQGGDKIDVFQSLGNFPNAVATSMAYDITDLVETHAAESLELFTDEWLAACMANGRLYGLPTMKPIALTPMVIYRQDIADVLKIDMSKIKSVYDLTDIFKKVKAEMPNMTPLAPVSSGDIGLMRFVPEIDNLGDNLFTPMAVLQGDSMSVINYYEIAEFVKLSNLARTWYNQDLVMKDAATTTSAAAELMASGNYFCYIASYSYPEADTAAALEAQAGGYDLGAKKLGSAYLSTSDINGLTWMVSSTSNVPESALKFLNMTFTDVDIVNLLIYGIKDRDYVLDAEGFMSYPPGKDATTVPYTAQLSCGTLGNYFIMHPMAGTSKDSLAWCLEQNRVAKTSPAMGFTFNSSNITTEYTAVTNVIQQFLPGLATGSVDPATEIPVFLQRLKEAGIDRIISEKQGQLDTWAANNR